MPRRDKRWLTLVPDNDTADTPENADRVTGPDDRTAPRLRLPHTRLITDAVLLTAAEPGAHGEPACGDCPEGWLALISFMLMPRAWPQGVLRFPPAPGPESDEPA
ncbi:hypothetical protein [Nocardia sp. N2S4-5]|uniref:hypothetical protein n=1 Tax=Nocardia sp. N2S4-5 TaxID=3351565 RepID=UPI0037CE40ED